MEEIKKKKGKMNDMSIVVESKKYKNATSGKPTKSVKAQPAIASQPVGTTDGSQAPNEMENGLGSIVPNVNGSTPDATANSASTPFRVMPGNRLDRAERLTFRYSSSHEAREALSRMTPIIAARLPVEGLPIPPDEELKDLAARAFELGIMVGRKALTREQDERIAVFMQDFVSLACAPE